MGLIGPMMAFKCVLKWIAFLTTISPILGTLEKRNDGETTWEESLISGEDLIRYWLETPRNFDRDSSSYTQNSVEDFSWEDNEIGDVSVADDEITRDTEDENESNRSHDIFFRDDFLTKQKSTQQRDVRAAEDIKTISKRNISPKYILILNIDEDVSGLTEAQKQDVISSLASLFHLPSSHVHISNQQSQGHLLGLYFVRAGAWSASVDPRDLIPASELLFDPPHTINAHLTSVQVYDIFSQDALVVGTREMSLFHKPFFPYMMATAIALFLCLLALLIWCCIKHSRRKQTTALSTSTPSKSSPRQISVLYPPTKPSVASASGIQPDVSHILTSRAPLTGGSYSSGLGYGSSRGFGSPLSSSGPGTPVYSSSSQSGTPVMGTPVHTPPLRMKKGLLERRGSNASLTIDLGSALSDQSTVGSPPRESTAEEYLQSASHKMTLQQVRDSLREPRALYQQFWEIPMNHPDRIEVAGSGMKNRYRTIIPNEHSRVKLAQRGGDPLSGYINANYIRGYGSEQNAYIATQGPMSNTVSDFWRMIWQEKSPIVIMITKLKEKSRTKCENYVPDLRGTYDDLEVMVRSTSEREGYICRQLTIKYLNEEHRLVHYWYMAWPDHKAPCTARQLLHLVLEVDRQRNMASQNQGPVVVHCSAGIGRTGCFIGASIGVEQLRQESEVDILSIVCQMRLDRGGMVQTNEQYEFVHQALSLYGQDIAADSSS